MHSKENLVLSCLSFGAAEELTESFLDPECFGNDEKPFYEDCKKIIAEMFMINPDRDIPIAGENLKNRQVREVYLKLTPEHIRLVHDNFAKVKYAVRYKKAYLRTALYNSFFELELSSINEFESCPMVG